MKQSLMFILIMCFFQSIQLLSQETIIVSATNGNIHFTSDTEDGVEYLITVEGTYSMWPQFNAGNEYGCTGVDAAYIYKAPKEEIDDLRWPPDSINVPLIGKIAILPLPNWVGDDRIYELPPRQIATPLLSISFREYTGFRIDGEPLPNSGYNTLIHRYQITKTGNGKPFSFQILDSTYDVIKEKVLARYEDNCGELRITIRKVKDEDVTICGLEPICKDGKYIGIKLDASILLKDSTLVKGERNILSLLGKEQISIVDNGKFICQIDSIVCNNENAEDIGVGILFDKSGSMLGPISDTDKTIRLEASKNSVINFINNLRDIDSTFILSFSSSTNLESDWSNDKVLLENKINNIIAGGTTQFYGALLEGLNKIKLSKNSNRFIVMLSDGANTASPDWNDNYLTILNEINIPVYFVALGFTSEKEDVEALSKMELLAKASKGKVFDVRNADELKTVYNDIITEYKKSECCTIYFPIDPCEEAGESRTLRLLFAKQNSEIISEYVTFDCIDCDKLTETSVIPNTSDFENTVSIIPNPNNGSFAISFDNFKSSSVKIDIFDSNGKFILNLENRYISNGIYNERFEDINLNSGVYFIKVSIDDKSFSNKFIVKK